MFSANLAVIYQKNRLKPNNVKTKLRVETQSKSESLCLKKVFTCVCVHVYTCMCVQSGLLIGWRTAATERNLPPKLLWELCVVCCLAGWWMVVINPTLRKDSWIPREEVCCENRNMSSAYTKVARSQVSEKTTNESTQKQTAWVQLAIITLADEC